MSSSIVPGALFAEPHAPSRPGARTDSRWRIATGQRPGPAVLAVPVVALVCQQMARVLGAPDRVALLCHLVALGWLAVVSARATAPLLVSGMLASAGGALNVVAVVIAGGRMPVTSAALAHLSKTGNSDLLRGHVVVDHGLASVIGDAIAVPVLHLAASPGDLLVASGALIAAATIVVRRRRARRIDGPLRGRQVTAIAGDIA